MPAASERSRAFLAEYARRSRAAETELLLATLARMEALVRTNAAAQADVARVELRMLHMTIRDARPEIEASALPTRAAKLAALLDLLEVRIAALAAPTSIPAALDTMAEAARTRLALVPPPQEPELPIPSPAASKPPPIALARATSRPETSKSPPEITWLSGPPQASAAPDDAEERSGVLSPAPSDKAAALSETMSMPNPLTAGTPSDEAKNWELT
jgi:hypothetical protein